MHYGEQGWRAFLAQLEADRARRVLTGNSERRSLAETLAQNAEETAFLDEMAARFPAYRNEIELESADNTLAFRPVDALTHCQCPILFIHGTEDRLVLPDHTLAMHKQAGTQSELTQFEGAGHDLAFGPYQDEVRSLTLAWLARHLAPEASADLKPYRKLTEDSRGDRISDRSKPRVQRAESIRVVVLRAN